MDQQGGQPLIKEGQRTQTWASVKQYWFVGKVRIKRDIGSFEGLTVPEPGLEMPGVWLHG